MHISSGWSTFLRTDPSRESSSRMVMGKVGGILRMKRQP